MSTPNLFQACAKIARRVGAAPGIAGPPEALSENVLSKCMASYIAPSYSHSVSWRLILLLMILFYKFCGVQMANLYLLPCLSAFVFSAWAYCSESLHLHVPQVERYVTHWREN